MSESTQKYLKSVQKELTIVKKIAIDSKQWFCIIYKHRVVAGYKLKRDAQWKIDNFVEFPTLPL